MKKFLKEWKLGTDFGVLALRLAMGFGLFYAHGMGKLGKLFSGAEIHFMDPIGLGEKLSFGLVAFAEGICSLLVMVGLFTRFAVVAPIITMLVIVFSVHSGGAFKELELPFLYLIGYFAIFLTGGGKHSIDRLITK
ncbi:MAG: DoxX family protein [Brumimicrobium sp.]|nr:DoxX family protein [Brumimicrobium sp.]